MVRKKATHWWVGHELVGIVWATSPEDAIKAFVIRSLESLDIGSTWPEAELHAFDCEVEDLDVRAIELTDPGADVIIF
jgi:hypothetical protein